MICSAVNELQHSKTAAWTSNSVTFKDSCAGHRSDWKNLTFSCVQNQTDVSEYRHAVFFSVVLFGCKLMGGFNCLCWWFTKMVRCVSLQCRWHDSMSVAWIFMNVDTGHYVACNVTVCWWKKLQGTINLPGLQVPSIIEVWLLTFVIVWAVITLHTFFYFWHLRSTTY